MQLKSRKSKNIYIASLLARGEGGFSTSPGEFFPALLSLEVLVNNFWIKEYSAAVQYSIRTLAQSYGNIICKTKRGFAFG